LSFSQITDESKFGKKLMEKMGWSEGTGLGSTSQGMLDPIMLKTKDDNKVKNRELALRKSQTPVLKSKFLKLSMFCPW
jgi:hypothetical protein